MQNVTIQNLTISNGLVVGNGGRQQYGHGWWAGTDAYGGGIRNAGTLTITGRAPLPSIKHPVVVVLAVPSPKAVAVAVAVALVQASGYQWLESLQRCPSTALPQVTG